MGFLDEGPTSSVLCGMVKFMPIMLGNHAPGEPVRMDGWMDDDGQ